MRILVIGSGAREHAILRALHRDPAVTELHIAPGNAGTSALAPAHAVDVADPDSILQLARQLAPDLVVVGPEVPLVAGAVDRLQDNGFDVFGPRASAARIEGSKAFAKEVMTAAGVPTARALSVAPGADDSELEAALEKFAAPYVVKDDGLAAGKGVVVTDDRQAALEHGRAVLGAGHPVLIEEYLAGPEISLFAVCDGVRAVPLLPAQDFKRVSEGDRGPNTGGMGAYAPLPWAPDDLVATVQRSVLDPVLAAMAASGCPFSGLLYAGLVLTSEGVKVIEFNCRFGDPETQVVLELLASPLSDLLVASARGDLSGVRPRWHEGAAVTVVLAAENYPGTPVTGDVIDGLEMPSDEPDLAAVLHAGTRRTDDGIVSAGGRVLAVTARGRDLAQARERVYARLAGIELRGAHYRRDIAAAAASG